MRVASLLGIAAEHTNGVYVTAEATGACWSALCKIANVPTSESRIRIGDERYPLWLVAHNNHRSSTLTYMIHDGRKESSGSIEYSSNSKHNPKCDKLIAVAQSVYEKPIRDLFPEKVLTKTVRGYLSEALRTTEVEGTDGEFFTDLGYALKDIAKPFLKAAREDILKFLNHALNVVGLDRQLSDYVTQHTEAQIGAAIWNTRADNGSGFPPSAKRLISYLKNLGEVGLHLNEKGVIECE